MRKVIIFVVTWVLMALNFIFTKTFNLFDVAVFAWLGFNGWFTMFCWQYWVFIIPALLISVAGENHFANRNK